MARKLVAYFSLILVIHNIFASETKKYNVCFEPEDYDLKDASGNCWYNPDVDLTPTQIIQNYGYPVQVHRVTTDDGFFLELYRIPHGKNNAGIANKQPVFLQHGLLTSSAIWVLTGNRSLADNGYDVWLANSRGTTYSQGHSNFTRNSAAYWDWSFDEMGRYDLPASLDVVVRETGRTDIIFISISMGAQIGYVYATSKPEQAKEHIKLIINMGPGIYCTHIDKKLKFWLDYLEEMKHASSELGWYELASQTPQMRAHWENYCFKSSKRYNKCINMLFNVMGTDFKQLMPDTLPLIIGHHPAGISFKYILHLSQNMNKRQFAQYDYDEEENFKRYGDHDPSDYDMSKTKVPAFLIYSQNDERGPEQSVLTLYRKIPKEMRAGLFKVKNKLFNHIDFIFARDVVKEVYEKILEVLLALNMK